MQTTYQITEDANTVLRLPDNMSIPRGHRYWDEYEQWVAAGGVALPIAGTTLVELKTKKNAEINAWRAEANTGTFTHDGYRYSCDTLSRSDLDGTAHHIALFAGFPPGFPHVWKTDDNQLVPMESVEEFMQLYQSMAAQGTANFLHAQQLKAQLADAEDAEAVAAIVW